MRKRLLVLWMSLLCVCGLALPACGGSSGAANGEDAKASAVAADPAEKFYGTWKLAAMRSKNLTIVGDFSMFTGGEEGEAPTMVIEKGGTGAISLDSESRSLTWELSNDNTISVTPEKQDDAQDEDDADDGAEVDVDTIKTLDFVYGDEGLTAKYEDEETAYELVFNETGTLADGPEIDLEKAENFATLDELTGTWNLVAMKLAGATMYGEPEDLAEIYADSSNSATFEVAADGSATLFDQSCKCTVGENGASIDFVFYQIPIKHVGDYAIVDMSEFMGTEIAFCYKK